MSKKKPKTFKDDKNLQRFKNFDGMTVITKEELEKKQKGENK